MASVAVLRSTTRRDGVKKSCRVVGSHQQAFYIPAEHLARRRIDRPGAIEFDRKPSAVEIVIDALPNV